MADFVSEIHWQFLEGEASVLLIDTRGSCGPSVGCEESAVLQRRLIDNAFESEKSGVKGLCNMVIYTR